MSSWAMVIWAGERCAACWKIQSASLLQSPQLLRGLDLPRLRSHHAVSQGGLEPPQVLTNRVKVGVEPPGVGLAESSHFLYEWVFHGSSPRKASGGTISGHSQPAFSTVCRIIILVNGLLMWAKFHVTMNLPFHGHSIPFGVSVTSSQLLMKQAVLSRESEGGAGHNPGGLWHCTVAALNERIPPLQFRQCALRPQPVI